MSRPLETLHPTFPKPEGPFLGAKSFETACVSRRVAVIDEIDELGHVNNAVYVRWIQDAAVGHWTAIAGDAAPEKVMWVCSRHEVDYKDQVVEGDEVEIRTWLGEAKGARFARYTDIRKPGSKRPAIEAVTWWVLIDRKTMRPKRVDQETLEMFGLSS